LLLLGPLALSAKGRAGSRGVVWLACLIPCTYLGVLVENWGWGDRQSVGHLEGHRFISKVPGTGLLLARLEREPRGVVIEDPRDAGSEGLASLPLYAGHRLWLGWDGYESLWRGFPEDVGTRRRRLVAFFEGALPEPSAWLEAEGIDYVLFYRATDTPERWQALNASIQRSHVWCEILILENRPVGYWKRRPPISSVGR
jgi:hypothetical protein